MTWGPWGRSALAPCSILPASHGDWGVTKSQLKNRQNILFASHETSIKSYETSTKKTIKSHETSIKSHDISKSHQIPSNSSRFLKIPLKSAAFRQAGALLGLRQLKALIDGPEEFQLQPGSLQNRTVLITGRVCDLPLDWWDLLGVDLVSENHWKSLKIHWESIGSDTN